MSEKNDKNLRRIGRREQKERLESPDMLFPKEEDMGASDLDLSRLALPDTDAEAIEMLSSLKGEVKAPKITPPEERYPPIRPVAEKPMRPRQDAPTVVVPKVKSNNGFFNFMTLLILLGTALFSAWFVQIWIDPQNILNPLPPATPFIEVTATPNGNFAPPVATPDDSGQIFVVITETPSLIAATESPYPFIVQEILYAPNSNDLGCNWWSIAGTVTDNAGAALNGYRIRVSGLGLNESVFSGASQSFGAGGFELPLVGTPGEETFTVQLFSAQDAPLSELINVTTRADCDANVTIVNFIQNR
jgi:hypothetical protein